MMTLLEVRGLCYTYPGQSRKSLDGFNMSVEAGQVVVVAGRSGCGKSTLLRCINGILPHVSGGTMEGEIKFDGKPVMSLAPERRSAFIGTVYQDPDSQIIHMSVEDELAFGLENMAMRREDIARRVMEISGALSLETAADPNTLSGGNKQRLCAGSVLAMRPSLLLLDEPLSNMDSEGVSSLVSLLGQVKKEGYAAIVVEHRLEHLPGIADRVVYMDEAPPAPRDERPEYRPRVKEAPAVRVDGLYAGYKKGSDVLAGVTFEVKEGDMAVVLGRNGCGKSTLLKVLAKVMPARKGVVEICGKPLKNTGMKELRRNVGLVMQNPNHQLFMDSVFNEAYFNCADREAAMEVLRSLCIDHLADRHPYSLSEGEKRRLALAAALAAKPHVLLLDEPTLGQDRESLDMMLAALRSFNERYGMTIITVTHDAHAASVLGDTVIRLVDGAVHSIGGDEAIADYFYNHE